MSDEIKIAALPPRTKMSVEEKLYNITRVYETQIKQFAFQQAVQHALTDGSAQPKVPPMETILESADKIFKWFRDGSVPIDTPARARMN